MMDKVLLIDAHNAMWRASIGFTPKKVPPVPTGWEDNGQPNVSTNDEWTMVPGPPAPPTKEKSEEFVLIFNFFRNLRPIIEQFRPVKCFFVLEGHPQFRYDLFADYKANRIIKLAGRQEQQDKFHKSKDEIVRLLQYFPITVARAANYEADDTIGALCDNMRSEELTVLSSDSDFTQLLQRGYQSCQVYNPIKKVFVAAPDYPYVAWKCLNGDKSDNIPSLLKPKKALNTVSDPELFKKFMAVEENRANFSINRQLIEFHTVPEEEISMVDGTRNFAAIKQEFARMEFQSIINDVSWKKFTSTFDCLKY
jgi:5'-3' exonuclease